MFLRALKSRLTLANFGQMGKFTCKSLIYKGFKFSVPSPALENSPAKPPNLLKNPQKVGVKPIKT
jgi:hypothetical protein